MSAPTGTCAAELARLRDVLHVRPGYSPLVQRCRCWGRKKKRRKSENTKQCKRERWKISRSALLRTSVLRWIIVDAVSFYLFIFFSFFKYSQPNPQESSSFSQQLGTVKQTIQERATKAPGGVLGTRASKWVFLNFFLLLLLLLLFF